MSQRVQEDDETTEVQDETEITVPRKSIDPSLQLQERLSDNVVNRIGPARYFDTNADGEPTENWGDVFHRVASNIADAEIEFGADARKRDQWESRFESAMRELRFMPNTPTIASAGTELQMLSACFVLSPEDDMEDILETAKQWGLVEADGGGMGGAFYTLRPKGSIVSSTGGKSSGPMPFIELYDSVGSSIKQGGCIDASARVMSDEGYVPLEEIHDGRPLQRAGGEHRVKTRGGFDAVKESSDSGEQPVVEIETESGYTITVTENHELGVLRETGTEFVRAGEITRDDTVVLDQSGVTPETTHKLSDPDNAPSYHHNTQTVPLENYPDHVTDDLATVLGIIAGDGTVSLDSSRVIVTLGNSGNADQDAADAFVSFFEDMGFSVRARDRSGSGKGDYTRYTVTSGQLCDWLDANDLIPSTGSRPTVPEPVYREPSSLIHFCNGCTVDAAYAADADTISYSTASEPFSEELQDVLLASGIPSSRNFVESGPDRFGDSGVWTVTIQPGHAVQQFVAETDCFIGGEFTTGGQRQNQIDCPEYIDHILDAEFTKNTMTDGGVSASSLKSLRRYARGDRTPSLERVRSLLADVRVDPDAYDVLDDDRLYEPVSSVADSGTTHVCDIENITGEPEFIADNVVVHNIRSGAQMAIMHAHHADVGRFAVSKRTEGRLSCFNISVAVTDEFLTAVENDETYQFYTADSLGPDTGSKEPQPVIREAKHFWDPKYEDAWNDEQDKPGSDDDGEVVDENLWRDYDVTGIGEYRDRIDLEIGEPMELPAGLVWQCIIDGAWTNGEPGVFHIDESNREHTFDVSEHPKEYQFACNPCAEQMLSEGEACNLGHVNLSLMVDETAPMFGDFQDRHPDKDRETLVSAYLNRALDSDQLDKTVATGVRFLDNVVEQSEFPLSEIEEQVASKRKIGLGIMGFAQLCIQLGIEYGSDTSYVLAEELMRRIDQTATTYSHDLAKTRGPFPQWEDSKWADPQSYTDWFEKHGHDGAHKYDDGYLMRNHSVTTIAPTGTTSRVADTTGGCEPIYNAVFFKNVSTDIQGDEMLVIFDDYLERILDANGIDSDEVKDRAVELMHENEYDDISDVDMVPDEIADLFVTTEDLDLDQHLSMQAAFQQYCDSGISKTGNAPADTTRDEISDALLDGLAAGIKGTTVYRQGSRHEQVNTTKVDNRTLTDEEKDELLDTVTAVASDDESFANRLATALSNGGDE